MVEDEITCIRTDDSGNITHVGLKKGSTQPVSIIIHLMHHESYSFYILKDGTRKEVSHKSFVDGKAFLTIDPDSSLIDSLKFCQSVSEVGPAWLLRYKEEGSRVQIPYFTFR